MGFLYLIVIIIAAGVTYLAIQILHKFNKSEYDLFKEQVKIMLDKYSATERFYKFLRDKHTIDFMDNEESDKAKNIKNKLDMAYNNLTCANFKLSVYRQQHTDLLFNKKLLTDFNKYIKRALHTLVEVSEGWLD